MESKENDNKLLEEENEEGKIYKQQMIKQLESELEEAKENGE